MKSALNVCTRPSPSPRVMSASRTRGMRTVTKALQPGYKMQDCPDYFRVLQSSDGQTLSLSSFRGKQPVVLFFYPKQGTPGCTKEACAFRDEYERFQEAGAAVLGISSDSPQENAAFAKANNLPFPLLTDNGSILRKTFGIKGDLLGLLPGRQTYVIDKEGKVVMVFNSQFEAEKHVSEALAALEKAAK